MVRVLVAVHLHSVVKDRVETLVVETKTSIIEEEVEVDRSTTMLVDHILRNLPSGAALAMQIIEPVGMMALDRIWGRAMEL